MPKKINKINSDLKILQHVLTNSLETNEKIETLSK